MLRVLVADQHPVVRAGIRNLSALSQGWKICAELDGGAAFSYGPHVPSDVVILDPDQFQPGALLKEVLSMTGAAHSIIFTNRANGRGLQEALAAGATGYILKTDSVESLELGVRSVGSGHTYISAQMAQLLPLVRGWNGDKLRAEERYTRREMEVTHLIADGLSNKRIALKLGTSIKTVESHRASAMRKIGAHSGAELVRMAITRNLISC